MKNELLTDYENKTHASFRDSLTGLFNHGIFQTLLEEEIKRSKRYGDPFTLVFIDIDSFSSYNKKFTHTIGDQALIKVAKIIKENLRDPDIAARYSGDLFALILPQSSLPDAHIPIDRIRHCVKNDFNDSLTISAGIITFPKETSDKANLILKAQNALSHAKTMGKNKTWFLEEKKQSVKKMGSTILIVDDDPLNVKLLTFILQPFNHEIFKAYNGETALDIVKKQDIDLILLDAMMPGIDGFEVCRHIKSNEKIRLIPIIMLTALDDSESRIKGIEAGADDFITKPPNKIELMARINALLKMNELNKKLASIESVMVSLANAVEAKDEYTQGHTERVSELCVKLGKKMELSAIEIDALWIGGILHDIGKIGVSRKILNKPGSLDSEEFEIMKTHSVMGYKICLPLEKNLGPALEAILHHHEKLDGSGYPDGISGDEISVLARIMAIADIFDALDTDRPYRKAFPRAKTFEIMLSEANAGKLDKNILEHLINIIENIS